LTEYIIELLKDIEPAIAFEPFSDSSQPDMVIATGGDQAARHFQSQYANIPALIRGSRHSVAVLSGKESEAELMGLNRDIFSYDKPDEDLEADWEDIRKTLDEAIKSYSDMRETEGERIEADIRAKIALVSEYADTVEKISTEDTVGYRDKLEARLRQILGDNAVTVDENRLLTECAVWADKIAIDEELVRLRSHFGAFDEIINLRDPSGRKLDFLMQELNRETNTIGSKANNARIARIVVDMKGELEKIREQVQNIE
jgi:uncharacterized protein (TIGR00255 family)